MKPGSSQRKPSMVCRRHPNSHLLPFEAARQVPRVNSIRFPLARSALRMRLEPVGLREASVALQPAQPQPLLTKHPAGAIHGSLSLSLSLSCSSLWFFSFYLVLSLACCSSLSFLLPLSLSLVAVALSSQVFFTSPPETTAREKLTSICLSPQKYTYLSLAIDSL